MAEIPGFKADVHFGSADAELPDWRMESEDIEDPIEADEPDDHKDVLQSLFGYEEGWWEEGSIPFEEEEAPSAPFQFDESDDLKRLREFVQERTFNRIKKIREGLTQLKAQSNITIVRHLEQEIRALQPLLEQDLTAVTYGANLEGITKEADKASEEETSAHITTPEDIVFPGEPARQIELPALERVVNKLRKSPVAAGVDFRDTASKVRAGAFSITTDLTDKAVADVHDLFTTALEQGHTTNEFIEAVQDRMSATGAGPLSDSHLENVFRTNALSAMSDGRMEAAKNPLVADAFPYAAIWATHDARTRPNHLALEKLGLNGTNVYRVDDPTFQKFRAPWDYECRCSWNLMTVEQAARKGVKEAIDWLKRGTPPEAPEHVPPPPFEPSPTFRRPP